MPGFAWWGYAETFVAFDSMSDWNISSNVMLSAFFLLSWQLRRVGSCGADGFRASSKGPLVVSLEYEHCEVWSALVEELAANSRVRVEMVKLC